MGCKMSKGGGCAKDPEDKTLDELDIQEIGIGAFDDVFSANSDPLNTLVSLNNDLITSVERLKELAAMFLGSKTLVLKVANGAVSAEINETKGDDTSVFDAKTLDVKSPVGIAWKNLSDAITALNETPPGTVNLSMKRGRIVGVTEEKDPEVKNNIRMKVTSVNNAAFCMKKELIIANGKDALDPKKMFKEIVDNMKGALKDSFRANFNADLSGIAEGKISLDVNFGDIALDVLPKKIRAAYDALLGDEGLIPTIQNIVSAISDLMPQLEAAKSAIEGLPTEPDAIMDQAKEANLAPMSIPKIPGKIAGNVKQFAGAPVILSTLLQTIRAIVEDMRAAMV